MEQNNVNVLQPQDPRGPGANSPAAHSHVRPDGTVYVHTHDGDENHGHFHGHTHTNTKAVKNRLARVIGHLHSVERMIDQERDCAEVLIQLAAVRGALNNICTIILRDHMDHCILDAVRENDMEAIEELNKAIDMLMK